VRASRLAVMVSVDSLVRIAAIRAEGADGMRGPVRHLRGAPPDGLIQLPHPAVSQPGCLRNAHKAVPQPAAKSVSYFLFTRPANQLTAS